MTKLLAALLLFAGMMPADTIAISAQGVFSSDTPESLFTAPGGNWNLMLTASTAPLAFDADSFVLDVSSFQYELNSMMVDIMPVQSKVYDDALGGLFDITFVPGGGIPRDGFSFSGPAIFSGTTDQPMFVPGSYVPNDFSVVYVAAAAFPISSTPVVVSTSFVQAPEPGLGFSPLVALATLLALRIVSVYIPFPTQIRKQLT